MQLLLNLAESMSGGQTSLDKLVQRIMIDVMDLIKCTRCNVHVFDSARTEQVPVGLLLSSVPVRYCNCNCN